MRLYVVPKKNVFIIVVLILVVSCLLLYFTTFREVARSVFAPQNKELPIYRVSTEEKKIAISFDAAWGDEYTDDILDALDQYEIKTTFFLVGFWVDKYPDWVKQFAERGHEVGNHSSTHPHMSTLSKEQIIQELNETGDKIKAITGVQPTVFRPPFGDYNNLLIQTAEEQGYYVIQWDVDSLDWKELGVESVVDRVTRNVQPGSIVLFHNNAKFVPEYLPLVLERLKEQGYEIVPVSELIYKDNYTMDSAGQQIPNRQ